MGVATLGAHVLNAAGANIAGILTAASFSVGANEVVSSARQLKNIATLDATTKLTIENAISDPPNDFDDLNVVGLATVNRLFISGDTAGLNIIGVTTGLAVPGFQLLVLLLVQLHYKQLMFIQTSYMVMVQISLVVQLSQFLLQLKD